MILKEIHFAFYLFFCWEAMWYLKSPPARGLFFPLVSNLKLSGFRDFDWDAVDTRRSISGFCFSLGNALISWKSKKQPIVARNSLEAKYRALAAACCEAQWLFSYILI